MKVWGVYGIRPPMSAGTQSLRNRQSRLSLLGVPPQAYMPEAKSFCIWALREKFGNDWQKHFSHTDERQRQTFWEGGSKVVSRLLSGRSPLPSTLYSE